MISFLYRIGHGCKEIQREELGYIRLQYFSCSVQIAYRIITVTKPPGVIGSGVTMPEMPVVNDAYSSELLESPPSTRNDDPLPTR